MASEPEVRWQLGGFTGTGEWATQVRYFRAVTDEEAAQLQESSRVVRQLAALSDFQSLATAVQRWLDTLEPIRERLAAGDRLPRAVTTAAALDLSAICEGAVRCERGLTGIAHDLLADGHVSQEHVEAVEMVRRALQTRLGFLTLAAVAPDARQGRVVFSLDDQGAVRLDGVTACTAPELGTSALGEVVGFMFGSVGPLAEGIAGRLSQLAALLDEEPAGVPPDLLCITGGDQPSNITTTSLPIAQAIALRHLTAGSGVITPADAIQRLGAVVVSAARPEVVVGGVAVTHASDHARVNTAINELPKTSFVLDIDLLGSSPVDLWGSVTFDMIDGDRQHRLFTGAVQDASGSESLTVVCEGGVQLTEHNRGSFAFAHVDPPEVMASVMRQIGLPADTIAMSSEEKLPRPSEPFEVFVPVRGVRVAEPVTLGQITFTPTEDGQGPLGAFNLTEELPARLGAEYRNATAYARAVVQADSLDEAEQAGYAAIEGVVAWLVARQRYGLIRLPDGTPQTFSRIQAVQSVRYAPVVLVRGQTTGRQWLRWVHNAGEPALRKLTPTSDLLSPRLPDELHPADDRALRALMRAANAPVLEEQVQALAEALENYVAGIDIPDRFSKQQRKELRALAPDWLDEKQATAFTNAINGVNNTSFAAKLSARLQRDGVTLTDNENELLDVLRDARNDVVHGRAIKRPPTRDEVLRAISVVARALMFGVAAREPDGSDTIP